MESEEQVQSLDGEVKELQNKVLLTGQKLSQAFNKAEKSHNRAEMYKTKFFNAVKAVDRFRSSAEKMKKLVQSLRIENKQLSDSLSSKEDENSSLRTRSESFQLMFEEAHARAVAHWNNFLACNNHRLMLLKRISTLGQAMHRLEIMLADSIRMNEVRRFRLSRAFENIKNLRNLRNKVENFMALTEKGHYSWPIRALVTRLLVLGCSQESVGKAVDAFMQMLGSMLGIHRGKRRIISARTASRIAAEAEVITKLQLGYEMKQTPCELFILFREWLAETQIAALTTGGDGTTIKNRNYQAMNINMQVKKTYRSDDQKGTESPEMERKIRFLGVQQTANHRAATQKDALIEQMHDAIDVFNRSPLGDTYNTPGQPLSEAELAAKYLGSHGDHAEDQKATYRLLGNWKEELTLEWLGASYFHLKPREEQEMLMSSARFVFVEEIGGEDAWRALSDEEREKKEEEIRTMVYESLGPEAFDRLPESDKRRVKIFVFIGCGMHKDLNAVKGGNLGMIEFWLVMRVGPVELPNRDNAIVLGALGGLERGDDGFNDDCSGEEEVWSDAGEEELSEAVSGLAMLQGHQMTQSQVQQQHRTGVMARRVNEVVQRARNVTKGGAIKSTTMMGNYLNPRDDKKGQQDVFRYYSLHTRGYTFKYPPTSNTRYSSHLDAAAETISDVDFYINFIYFVRDGKKNKTLNHLEANILKALTDPPTLTELAVLALYREVVALPFVEAVRRNETDNALDFKPLYDNVLTHIEHLISEPSLILAPNCDPKMATLDSRKEWNCPDAIRAIHSRASEWPWLEGCFKAFLTGALSTWKRFSSEFNDDGLIAALTQAERDLAWMPATNDTNEGALGSTRVFKRSNPTAALPLFNAIYGFRRNETEDFRDAMLTSPDHFTFIIKEARQRQALRREQKRGLEIIQEEVREVEGRRQKAVANNDKKNARKEFLRNLALVTDRVAIDQMTVSQLKDQIDKLREEIGGIPSNNKMPRKKEKREEFLKALARYEERHGRDTST